MTSLIQTSIEVMGNPNTSTKKEQLSSSSETSVDSTTANKANLPRSSVNSIPLFKSIQDWWTSSLELKREHGKFNKDDAKFKEALLGNRKIEYDLFRAVLPETIYIESPLKEENEEYKSSTMRGKLLDVELNDGSFIHEFYLENTEPGPEQHVVIIHGYMAALGYFIKNIDLLIQIPGIRIHLIDLPGFGNSARPKFPRQFLTTPTKKRQQIEQILEIESWFIDKIENWRIIRNISQFKLIAHSMGAYLSCCYLMKYGVQEGGKIVTDLILVSPMGTESNEHSLINDEKYNVNLHYPSNPLRELQYEDDDNQEVVISPEFTKAWELVGKPKFPKSSVLQKLWENNKSPFDLLQKTGPFYSKLISYWSFARFKNFSNSEDTLDLIYKLHGYSFSIFNQYQALGELAITKLINHEILAKLPLCDRGFVDLVVDNNINTLWVYGDKDWMNSKGGEYIFKKIQEKNDAITKFTVVDDAGHHVYLDNPQAFNELVLEFLF